MSPHDILTLYSAKAVEYLLAVALHRVVRAVLAVRAGRRRGPRARVGPREPGQPGEPAGSRSRPPRYFHPGHAWARVEADGFVTIGMDDFAQKLVGEVKGVRLPAGRLTRRTGGTGVGHRSRRKAVDMLAPIGGTVVAVNSTVEQQPTSVNQDPYGRGWLLRLRAAAPDGAPRGAAHRRCGAPLDERGRRGFRELADAGARPGVPGRRLAGGRARPLDRRRRVGRGRAAVPAHGHRGSGLRTPGSGRCRARGSGGPRAPGPGRDRTLTQRER